MKDETLRILVPLDGSPAAEAVLPAIMPLVAGRAAELTLLQVIDQVDEIEIARGHLARVRRDLELDGVRAVSRLEFGRPADEILHLAEPRKHQLVAMTTHGRNGLRRVMMGSVAEEVLRHSKVPLLLNRPETRVGDWKRIVMSVDGSAASESILEEVARLAILMRATVHVVRVSLPLLPTTDLFFEPQPPVVQDQAAYLDGICDRLVQKGLLAVAVTREGFAGQEIVRYASEIGAGLIAMCSEGRTGMARLVAGSVAEEVLRIAPCPVLIRRLAAAEVAAGTR